MSSAHFITKICCLEYLNQLGISNNITLVRMKCTWLQKLPQTDSDILYKVICEGYWKVEKY